MSKKNSSVNLKKCFEGTERFSYIYQNFKKKLRRFKTNSFLVAISGGPDSLALAALIKAYNYEKKMKLQFVLVNHNIRKNSLKEALMVKRILKKYKIALKILNNKKKITNNIQSQARQIRYELLKKFCIQKKIKTILTGHNLEDQVETFFIRLSRGSGLKGLSAMKNVTKLNNDIKILRPLLDVKKELLIKLSKYVFGKFFNDPSNTNNKYLRTKIRKLQKHLVESGIKYDQIIKSIKNLASSRRTLDDYLNKIFKDTINRSKDTVYVDLEKYKKFNNEIKLNILNKSIKTLKRNYYPVRSKKVLNLIKKLENRNFRKATLGGCIFFFKKDKLCLKKEQKI